VNHNGVLIYFGNFWELKVQQNWIVPDHVHGQF
jgi:hypothetical protein